jgi:hypothetical protein
VDRKNSVTQICQREYRNRGFEMKRKGKKWFFMGLVLLTLILSVVTAVASGTRLDTADTIARSQVVQHLIGAFANPACTSSEVNAKQTAFDPTQPVANCWLVIEARTASNHTQNEGVQNER